MTLKKLVWGLSLASLAAIVVWRVTEKVAAAQKTPAQRDIATTPVAVEPVRTMTIQDIRRFSGSIVPRQQFVVAPKVAGRLETLLVNIGDTVANGDLVARLDDQEYRQQVEEARAALEVARAIVSETAGSRDLAQRDFDRVQALIVEKVASEAELDQARAHLLAAQARHDVALAQIRQNEAALKASEVRLSYTEIRAAWEGENGVRVVGERFVDEGAMLKANEPIVSILDIQTVLAVLSVIERDYALIRTGQVVSIATDAWPGLVFTGTVARMAPLLKESSRQARVEVSVPNPDGRLAPGLFVRAEMPFATRDEALTVPTAAVVRRDGQSGLFQVSADGRARFVPVTPGIVNGPWTEIREPALTGSVIVLGQHLLNDEAPVRVVAEDAPAP